MTALPDLIARVEAAECGSRELDGEIVMALCPGAQIGEYCGYEDIVFHAREMGIPDKEILPFYSTSIDAALTLVNPEAYWRLGHDGDGADPSEFKAHIIVPSLGGTDVMAKSIAATPALALCCAALRARMETPS